MISQISEDLTIEEMRQNGTKPPIVYCSLESSLHSIVNAFNLHVTDGEEFEKSMRLLYHQLINAKTYINFNL